jgi:hypothetical protein
MLMSGGNNGLLVLNYGWAYLQKTIHGREAGSNGDTGVARARPLANWERIRHT